MLLLYMHHTVWYIVITEFGSTLYYIGYFPSKAALIWCCCSITTRCTDEIRPECSCSGYTATQFQTTPLEQKDGPSSPLCNNNQCLLHHLNNCTVAHDLRRYNISHDEFLQEIAVTVLHAHNIYSHS